MSRWLLLPAAAALLAASPAAAAEPPLKTVGKYEIPYRLTDTKHVLVRVKLNGKGPYNFILDTGAPAVFIPKKLAKDLAVETDDKGWGDLSSFEVEGGLKVDKVRTRVEDLFQLEGMNGMGLAGVELHGVVGYNVLARFRITYDFSADKLAWVPLADFDPPAIKGIGKGGGQGGLEIMGPVMKMMAGFLGIVPNFEVRPRGFLGAEIDETKKGLFVKSVVPDGPAARAGLKPGDKLVRVVLSGGGKRKTTTDIDVPKDLARALADAKAGQEATIEVKRTDATETITLTLGKGL